MRRLGWLAAVVCAVAFAAPAEAQSKKKGKQGDFNVMLGGGFGDYTGELEDITEAGPTWGVTVNVQPWNVLGYELAYDGSRNLVDDERLAESPALTRHAVSGMLKLAPPFIERIRPFVGAGLGASMVRVSGEANGLYQNDFVEELPVAAGIEFNTGAFTAGFRTEYRWLIDESFADPAIPTNNPQGGFLGAKLNLGARF